MLKLLPESILKYLIDKLPPFTGILMVKTTFEGTISGWYGKPDDYLDRNPEIGEDVCELVPAIFGMIPPMVVPVVMPRIQTRDQCVADIHIIQDEMTDDYWIFFVDQTKEVENIRQLLQRLNEIQIKTGILPVSNISVNPFGNLHLLDYVTFLKQENGFFILLGERPEWFKELAQDFPVTDKQIALAEKFPFIDVFVMEADDFWKEGKPGNLKSGIWNENATTGKTFSLNAFAINLNELNYLLIKPLFDEYTEEQDLMQRAREQSLAYEKLAKTERKLQELLDYKEKFVSIVSHDLRSPVASVLSIAQVLNSDAEFMDHLSDFNREMIKNIQDEMHRLLDYNDKLYHWSNLELGNFELVTSRIPLVDLVKSAERTAKPKLNEKQILFKTRVDEELLVEVDKTLFLQVLNNLLGNAVKFTPTSGIIEVMGTKKETYVELIIHDSGVGMSESVMNNLFHGFVRESTQGTQGEKGTGLGMGIVKKILDAHKVTIKVDSSPNQGTSFIIYLPLV
jgi:signal transduction histidine kinase